MALDDKQDEATLPRIPFCDYIQQGICAVRRRRNGIRPYPGGGFGLDKGKCVHGKHSAENAGHPDGGPLEKVSEENRETTKKHGVTISPAQIFAPEHELKREKKHHQNLRDNPVRLVGTSHKKARPAGDTQPPQRSGCPYIGQAGQGLKTELPLRYGGR